MRFLCEGFMLRTFLVIVDWHAGSIFKFFKAFNKTHSFFSKKTHSFGQEQEQNKRQEYQPKMYEIFCFKDVVGALVTHIGSGCGPEMEASFSALDFLVAEQTDHMGTFVVFLKVSRVLSIF